MATKRDLRRELRSFYSAGPDPIMVEVPHLAFLMIDGHGDPNTSVEYSLAVQSLYAVAYAAKFAVKRAPDGIDYGVMPLEGLWSVSDMSTFTVEDKSAWDWTLMIMQPGEVTPEILDKAKAVTARKQRSGAVAGVRLERFAEGLSAQVMHMGPYAAEGPTIQRLHGFIAEHGYVLAGKHHEVYLSDPRRAAPERMKTILRQPVAAGPGTVSRMTKASRRRVTEDAG